MSDQDIIKELEAMAELEKRLQQPSLQQRTLDMFDPSKEQEFIKTSTDEVLKQMREGIDQTTGKPYGFDQVSSIEPHPTKLGYFNVYGKNIKYSLDKGNYDDYSTKTVKNYNLYEKIKGYKNKQKKLLEEISKKGETLGSLDQLGYGTKMTPSGKAGYVEAKVGSKAIISPYFDMDGNIDNLVWTKPDGTVGIIDKNNQTFGDFIDDVLRYTPNIVEGGLSGALQMFMEYQLAKRGGKAVSAPARHTTAAIADTLTGAARQGISEMLPGEDFPEGGRDEALLANIVGGQIGEGVITAGGLAKKYGPFALARERKNYFERSIQGGEESEALKQSIERGKYLEKEVGEPLNAFQLANTETSQGTKTLLERTSGSAEKLKIERIGQVAATEKYLDDAIDNLAGRKVNIDEAWSLGDKAGNIIANHFQSLRSNLGKQASQAFKNAEEMSKATFPINYTNTVAAMKEEIGRRGKILISSRKSVIDKLSKDLEELEKAGNQGSLMDLQSDLHDLSHTVYGKGNYISETIGPATDKAIARRILGALRKDLDEAVVRSDATGEAARELVKGRNLTKAMYDEMDKIQNDAVKKVLNQTGNKSTVDFVQNYWNDGYRAPDQAAFMSTLTKIDPVTAGEVRAGVLKRLFSKVGKGEEFSLDTLLTTTSSKKTDTWQKLEALMAGEPKAKQFVNRLRIATEYAKRVTRKGNIAQGYSPTYPLFALAEKAINGIPLVSEASRLVEMLKHITYRYSDPAKIAEDLSNQETRDIVLGIIDPPPKTAWRTLSRYITDLAAIHARDEGAEQK